MKHRCGVCIKGIDKYSVWLVALGETGLYGEMRLEKEKRKSRNKDRVVRRK